MRALGPREGLAGPPGVLRAVGGPLFACSRTKSWAALFHETRKQPPDGKTAVEKKGVCVCVCVCVCVRTRAGVGKPGKRERRREEGKNKTRENSLIQKTCGFLLVV